MSPSALFGSSVGARVKRYERRGVCGCVSDLSMSGPVVISTLAFLFLLCRDNPAEPPACHHCPTPFTVEIEHCLNHLRHPPPLDSCIQHTPDSSKQILNQLINARSNECKIKWTRRRLWDISPPRLPRPLLKTRDRLDYLV